MVRGTWAGWQGTQTVKPRGALLWTGNATELKFFLYKNGYECILICVTFSLGLGSPLLRPLKRFDKQQWAEPGGVRSGPTVARDSLSPSGGNTTAAHRPILGSVISHVLLRSATRDSCVPIAHSVFRIVSSQWPSRSEADESRVTHEHTCFRCREI